MEHGALAHPSQVQAPPKRGPSAGLPAGGASESRAGRHPVIRTDLRPTPGPPGQLRLPKGCCGLPGGGGGGGRGGRTGP